MRELVVSLHVAWLVVHEHACEAADEKWDTDEHARDERDDRRRRENLMPELRAIVRDEPRPKRQREAYRTCENHQASSAG
jgi:hypothetical protein